MIRIVRFKKGDQEKVREFVLNIQNNEFGLGFTEAEQPDLIDTEKYYTEGGFWTAKVNDEIVGTIGLQNLDDQNGILRKMFVKKELRGKPFGIGQQLFDTLKTFSLTLKLRAIWLDSPAIAVASHRLYERNGFKETDRSNLPEGYLFPDRNSKIYRLFLI